MSKIEWTERTWNPIAGCSVISPGCTNCYAMTMAARIERMQPGLHYDGLTQPSKAGPVWTAKIGFSESILLQPLRRRKPTMYFVNSMSDLFHEGVSDDVIDRVFAVMAMTPQHTYQVLTKRPDRMREYLNTTDRALIIWIKMNIIIGSDRRFIAMTGTKKPALPLPNVWLGVSAEDQKRADDRIPHLLATPAAVRFVSAEPLLGSVSLSRIRIAPDHHTIIDALNGYAHSDNWSGSGHERTRLNWIIVGGESGKGARPMHPDWVRSIRDQCAAASTAFFFKQWGEWFPRSEWEGNPDMILPDDECAEWPSSNNLRHMAGEILHRVGKRRADRKLDGVIHDAMPEVRI